MLLSGGQLEWLTCGLPEDYRRKLRKRRNVLKRRGLGVKIRERRTEKQEREESADTEVPEPDSTTQ